MEAIRAKEGWFVLHLFYKLDRTAWRSLHSEDQTLALTDFKDVVEEFRKAENCQAYSYSIWGHKADLAVMLVDPELNHLNQAENDLLNAFPAGVLQPVHSFISMSETSEYIAQEVDYDRTLREKEGLSPESPEYQEKMTAFRQRIQSYVDERLHPRIPKHKVMCFYPMNKARRDQSNWYLLDFDSRKQLMSGHMITGRKFAGKVQQLVTGSFGLDNWEWGVTLFADDPYYFKRILYEMRFDRVSAIYGEFGDFLVGLQLDPEEIFDRLGLAQSSRELAEQAR